MVVGNETRRMKIVCDNNMPFAREAFGTLGEVRVLDGRQITPADLRDADLLAVRSTCLVNRELLDGAAVRFVGTATIGFDHFDVPYLERRGIRWCCAPGCNANSVAEYVTAALLRLAVRHGFPLAGKTIGVVGVGNVGALVARQAEALGLRVLRNDPPRQRRECGAPGGESAPGPFVPLRAVLAEADVITLHAPLTRAGPDATWHMADGAFFGRMKPGGVFLNTARGAVADTAALLAAVAGGRVAHAVVDTWEGEPVCRRDLLDRVALGTPHIAGHSFEGKALGTVMVYREACRFLGVAPAWSPDRCWPPPRVPAVAADAGGRPDEEVLDGIVRQVYDIEADDRRLRASRGGDARERAAAFDELRRTYPVRREFRFTRVTLRHASPQLLRTIERLGFLV